MAHEGFLYTGLLLVLTAGIASLLSGEFFHGVEYLVPVGGVLAMVSVAGVTFLVSRADVPEEAEGGH